MVKKGSEYCIFCGVQVFKDGEYVSFPETFTAYQFLQAGDKACGRCAGMFRDPKFRRNCWLVKVSVFTVLLSPLSALFELPEPPFLLYFTRQKRKHGWILAVQNPVLSLDKFILVVDEDKILFEHKKFEEFLAFSRDLLNRGVPKGVLLGGMPNPSSLRKYGLSWPEAVRLRDLQREPLWRVCVDFERRS